VDVARQIRVHGTEEADLRLTLERVLSGVRGQPVTVSALRREASPFATVSCAEVLSISLADGARTSVFLKHLGPEQADHPDKQCRDREVRVYEQLLNDKDLPAAAYYGSRWNARAERREVFLEFVDDWNLTCHHLEHWFTAARRLARLHAHFAARADQLWACGFLLRLDLQYLCDWAGLALSVVTEQSHAWADELGPVVARYGGVAEFVARQPPTLVHNDLAPKNVLVDRSASPARVCFVDWEMAGVGCGLMDLVHLKHGLGPADDREMCAAYCSELEGTGLLPADQDQRGALFAACELHQTLFRLAHLCPWGVTQKTAAQWVAEARRLFDRAAQDAAPRCDARPAGRADL
jgi:hypothetical protein